MLLKKRKLFREGRIGKHAYMESMFDVHRTLFQYPPLLADSPVKAIEIGRSDVVFHIVSGEATLKMCFDPQDAYSIPLTLLNLSRFEEEESRIMRRLIRPGDVVFDIGANIGWYTIGIGMNVPNVEVYSFEPIPASFELLKKNLTRNGLPADRIFNFGFYEDNGRVPFYFDIECASASSMADLREDEQTTVLSCEVRKLDDFVEKNPRIRRLDFIKCDVEGSELFVYRGGVETIRRHRPIIFSEMLRKWSKKFGYHPNDIIAFFRDLGYGCFVVHGAQLVRMTEVTESTIETNYLFLHEESHEGLIAELGLAP